MSHRMHRFPFTLFLAAGLLLGASAPSAAGLTPDQAALLADADPAEVGKWKKKCAKCHGDDGISDDDEVPHLAGQNARYMFRQLLAFKNDAREGGRMNKTARKLSDRDMANLVALYSTTPLPPMRDEPVPAAPALVTGGDPGRQLESCAKCHGDNGLGSNEKYDAPALAGMPYDYFVATMEAFRDGSRANDDDGVMRDAAKALTDAEMEALADYYLALGKRQRLPAN